MSRDAYKQKTEAKIEQHQAQLMQAKAKAKGAVADVRIEAEKEIGELEKKLAGAKAKLAEIGEAAEDAWEDVSKKLDDTWDDLSGRVKGVMARFEKKDKKDG